MSAPNRINKIGPITLLCLVPGLALFSGCNSPTSPIANGPVILSGRVATLSVQDHFLTLKQGGTVAFELLSLRPILYDITAGQAAIVIAFSVGLPVEGACVATSTRNPWRVGEQLFFGLAAGDYCVRVGDGGSFPADALVEYEIRASNRDKD